MLPIWGYFALGALVGFGIAALCVYLLATALERGIGEAAQRIAEQILDDLDQALEGGDVK